jgi:hypothetical protein
LEKAYVSKKYIISIFRVKEYVMEGSDCCLLLAGFLLGLFFDCEGGG